MQTMAGRSAVVRPGLRVEKRSDWTDDQIYENLTVLDLFEKGSNALEFPTSHSDAAWPMSPVTGGVAMAEVTFIRNPYPLPDVVREGVWLRQPVLGSKVSPKDRDWSAKLKAHERLFAHHTLNSIRRDNRLQRSQVPEDALDLALTTVYVHSKDTLVPKSYVPVQPETLGQRTWRVLKNQIEVYKTPDIPVRKDPISLLLKRAECYRGPVPERRVHPSSVKLNISGPHSVQSNPGYSRKIDGTFYNI